MASIALAELRDRSDAKRNEAIQEPELVGAIIERFIGSNGWQPLKYDRVLRQQVAACVLAVELFSDRKEFKLKVPESSEKVANWVSEMNFFPFSRNDVLVRDLVTSYGL